MNSMLPSLIPSLPRYPAASYQHASHYRPDGHLRTLFPTSLAIRVTVRGDYSLLTIQAMPISPGIRTEELIHQLLILHGIERGTQAMHRRLLNILLMRRIVIRSVVLSVTSTDTPTQLIQSIEHRSVHEPLTSAIYNPASLQGADCAALLQRYIIPHYDPIPESLQPNFQYSPVEGGKTLCEALMLDYEFSIRHALLCTFIAVIISIVSGVVAGFAAPHWDLNVALSVGGWVLAVFAVIIPVLFVAHKYAGY